MKTFIEVNFKNSADSKTDVYTVVLDVNELAKIAKNSGLQGANKALDSFVGKFTEQFKERLSQYINR